MPKHVVYLYRGFPDKVTQLAQRNIDGLFFRPGTVLVGIDTTKLSRLDRNKIVEEFSLREFEVEQEKFHVLIEKLPQFGAHITQIEIPGVQEIDEVADQWSEAMDEQDAKTLAKIARECWDYGHDVKALEFYLNDSRIRYTSLAELDVSSKNSNIQNILNTYPVGVLSGVIREDGL